MNRIFFQKIKGLTAFFAVISLVTSFVIGPIFVHAQALNPNEGGSAPSNTGNGGTREITNDIFRSTGFLQQYDSLRDTLLVEDPSLFTPESGPLPIPTLEGTAGSCITALLGNFVVNTIGGLTTFAVDQALSLLGAEVPTKDDRVRSNTGSLARKETGTPIGPVNGPSLDGLAFCLVNATIEALLQGTIEWAKSGFNGNPVFVDDPEKFFTGIGDVQVGMFLDDISNGFLCSPWDVQVRLRLLKSYTSHRAAACTLTQVVDNVEQFIAGDFEQGGWRGWFSLTQDPNNNPYGSYLLLNRTLATKVSARTGQVAAEVSWGDGFLAFKDKETGKTTTPGYILARGLGDFLQIPRERITFADEFDELITELINQLVKVALHETLGFGQ